MSVTLTEARRIAKKLRVNLDVIDESWWKYGLEIELEHGSQLCEDVNVTNDDLELTGMIALAHILEFPDYYQRLHQMEKKAKLHWADKEMPSVRNPN